MALSVLYSDTHIKINRARITYLGFPPGNMSKTWGKRKVYDRVKAEERGTINKSERGKNKNLSGSAKRYDGMWAQLEQETG